MEFHTWDKEKKISEPECSMCNTGFKPRNVLTTFFMSLIYNIAPGKVAKVNQLQKLKNPRGRHMRQLRRLRKIKKMAPMLIGSMIPFMPEEQSRDRLRRV